MESGAPILGTINSPSDIQGLSVEQLKQLAQEIRDYLTVCVAQTGGHLAPSLGVVELTIALHRIYNVPKDKIIWDVGHQAYVHKILTGRREQLPTIRQYQGISGFLRIEESEFDLYGAGHASTSISAALGFAKARDFRGGSGHVLALVGDGALTGGLALEGLNNAAASKTDITIILNDNEMSIAENVGALATYLAKLRMQPTYQRAEKTARGMIEGLPIGRVLAMRAAKGIKHAATYFATPEHTGLLFEEMGLTYIGPIDGHNIEQLLDVLAHVKRLKGPVLLHVLTVKGKGLPYAEADSRKYHGVTQFSPDDGKMEKKAAGLSYTNVFSDTLVEAAVTDDKIVAITAAMPDGTGLTKFASEHPARFFDVGIAEQHAVTFAAGLAASGFKPICAIYSTFLQRAYDIIIHDVALQHLPVRFFIDRAGLVGDDGGTHHGVFDLAYLRCIPNLVIMAPKDTSEMADMTTFALGYSDGPIALRYSRGGQEPFETIRQEIEIGKAEILSDEGDDVLLFALGAGVKIASDAAHLLSERGIRSTVINARFCKPLDEETLLAAANRCARVVTIEDGTVAGGFGSAVLQLLNERGIQKHVDIFGLPDHFVEHGPVQTLREDVGLTAVAIAAAVTGASSEHYDPARLSAKPSSTRH